MIKQSINIIPTMQNKLQELTDKIYNEGVLKAREEADGLLANARKEAALIVANAQKEADSILTSAQKKAEEVKRNLDGELKMSEPSRW
jgi:V/A-type H+-transporting ATPase subunit E